MPVTVSGTRFVPSALIVQMVVPQVKTILPRSGDQLMTPPNPTPEVSCFGFDPSAFMTNSSWMPATARPNAIIAPLGDQAYAPWNPTLLVKRVTPDPLGATVNS